MEQKFFESCQCFITPISPIHIGCGEDFEPTNYVIDSGWLYNFDPSRAFLSSEDREELLKATDADGYKEIANFFAKRKNNYKAYATALVRVSAEAQTRYRNLKDVATSNHVASKDFSINRTTYCLDENQFPYIPGSSIKGSIITAIVDKRNNQLKNPIKNNNEITALIGGDFETSPMRLLKIADFMPIKTVATYITLAQRMKKHLRIDKTSSHNTKTNENSAVPNYVEVILPGQYRSFKGAIELPTKTYLKKYEEQSKVKASVDAGKIEKSVDNTITDFKILLKDIHRYNMLCLKAEFEDFATHVKTKNWKETVEKILIALDKLAEQGNVCLIRLGKNCGAESKTLLDSAKIENRQERTTSNKTSTAWRALLTQNDEEPFGWAILEIAPTEDCAVLQNNKLDVSNLCNGKQDIIATVNKLYLEAEKNKESLIEEEKKATAQRKAQEELEKQQEQERLDNMSTNQKSVNTLVDKISNNDGPVDVGTELHDETMALVELAASENSSWSKEEKAYLVETLWKFLSKKKMDKGKATKFFKKMKEQLLKD